MEVGELTQVNMGAGRISNCIPPVVVLASGQIPSTLHLGFQDFACSVMMKGLPLGCLFTGPTCMSADSTPTLGLRVEGLIYSKLDAFK